jgi:hypothetical protein
VKFEFAFSAPVLCEPDIAFVPLHAPDAAQLVAFVALHVSCDAAPVLTLVGDADNVTAGAGVPPPFVTDTATVFAVEPPPPLHVSVKLALAVSALVAWVPDTDLVPDQLPEAVQLVAFVDDHVSFDVVPDVTDVGDAANVTVGLMLMNAVAEAVPPAPVQLKR